MNITGKRIKELLDNRNLTQTDLANMLGVHQQSVSRWVNSSNLKTSVIEDICKALRIPVIEFYFDEQQVGKYLEISPEWLTLIRKIEQLDTDIQSKIMGHFYSALDLVEEEIFLKRR
ncbi:MAG TPA: helix-turn-helix transcriptional regulator [Spirochaetota bacterium]|nr:helix-turn-helix transcriptional regulator [Spirochaetota bacterium]HPJ33376.1 helix-turn-helix transcriptional regulator [Spirochaetota bacterium]